MSTYNNLGTVEMWQSKKSALNSGKPTSTRPQIIDYDNSYLKKMNNLHGRFMDSVTAKKEEAEQILTNANANYDTLMSGIDNIISLIQRSESNGGVMSDSSDAYNARATNSSSLGSSMLGENPERDMAKSVSGVSSSLTSDVLSSQATASAANVTAVSSSLAANAMEGQSTASALDVNANSSSIGVSAINAQNQFGDYTVGSGCWSNLSSDEQVNVVGKLQSVGYTKEEINAIVSGNSTVPNVEVSALSTSLQDGLTQYPELRQDLKNRYGFDIFYDDGSVDNDKLSLVLLIDGKDEDDEYSLIEYLHSKYGIDIVSQDDYDKTMHLLEDLGDKFEQIRAELIDRYGFDIFNRDKTINRERLTLALLMDKENKNDEFDLIEFLTRVYDDEKNVEVKSNAVKTLSGVSLLGVTSSGMAKLTSKENDTDKKKIDDENNLKNDAVGKENGE